MTRSQSDRSVLHNSPANRRPEVLREISGGERSSVTRDPSVALGSLRMTGRGGFARQWGASVLVVLCVVMALTGVALAQDRKLGTIGPPPRKDPQRETSAEAVAPL